MDMRKPAPRHSVMILALIVLTLLGSLPGLSSLQVIDRDEARYAQASVQMRDSGDYVNIRFHDRERHKKPAGIYWLQTASLKAFSSPNKRDIWVHRLPSVLAGLIAVLGLYWAGLTLYGRRGAFIAALLLSTSLLFIFESHIAKTDAALCAASVWVLGALMRLRQSAPPKRQRRYALIFWAALGCSVIIKGPILPAIVIIALITAALWDKAAGDRQKWWPRLISPLGICLFGLICLPWYIMIFKLTGGGFFKTALGSDLAPKIIGGQEKHGAPPGFYTLTIFAVFWPAALFLFSAIAYGFKTARGRLPQTSPQTTLQPISTQTISRAQARWLLVWIVPVWIILEIIPTKLTHYALPLYPAIALLMAGAILQISRGAFVKTRRIGAVIFFIISAALVFVVAGLDAQYGAGALWVYGLGIIIIAAALITSIYTFRGQMRAALMGLVITGLGLSGASYGFILPQLTELRLAPRLMAALQQNNIKLPRSGGPLIRSPHFTEPSLVYTLGENILLGANALDFETYPLQAGQIWILDLETSKAQSLYSELSRMAAYNQTCLTQIGKVPGLNYSRGDEVSLSILELGCAQP